MRSSEGDCIHPERVSHHAPPRSPDPSEQQVARWNLLKNFSCFGRRRGIASNFIFENENHVFLGRPFGSFTQFSLMAARYGT